MKKSKTSDPVLEEPAAGGGHEPAFLSDPDRRPGRECLAALSGGAVRPRPWTVPICDLTPGESWLSTAYGHPSKR